MSQLPNDWEFSKENIQPIKRGRKIQNSFHNDSSVSDAKLENLSLVDESVSGLGLGGSFNISSATSSAGAGKIDLRRKFEDEIRSYAGKDPLDPWFRYVKWTEETCTSGGAGIGGLLEKCLHHFSESEEYYSDERLLKLWLRYIQIKGESPEDYKLLHSRKLFPTSAKFYVTWAEALEGAGNMKGANKIYMKAEEKKAEPSDILKSAFSKFQARAARQCISNPTEAPPDFEDENKRVAFGRVRSLASGATAVDRSSLKPAGKLRMEQGTTSNIRGAKFEIFDENTGQTLSSEKEMPSKTLPIATQMERENKQLPAKWTETKVKPRAHMPVIPVGSQLPDSSKAKFSVHVEEESYAAASSKVVPGCTSVLQTRVAEQPAAYEVARVIFDPPNPNQVMMCRVNQMYAGIMEYSFEQLRAMEIASKTLSLPLEKEPSSDADDPSSDRNSHRSTFDSVSQSQFSSVSGNQSASRTSNFPPNERTTSNSSENRSPQNDQSVSGLSGSLTNGRSYSSPLENESPLISQSVFSFSSSLMGNQKNTNLSERGSASISQSSSNGRTSSNQSQSRSYLDASESTLQNSQLTREGSASSLSASGMNWEEKCQPYERFIADDMTGKQWAFCLEKVHPSTEREFSFEQIRAREMLLRSASSSGVKPFTSPDQSLPSPQPPHTSCKPETSKVAPIETQTSPLRSVSVFTQITPGRFTADIQIQTEVRTQTVSAQTSFVLDTSVSVQTSNSEHVPDETLSVEPLQQIPMHSTGAGSNLNVSVREACFESHRARTPELRRELEASGLERSEGAHSPTSNTKLIGKELEMWWTSFVQDPTMPPVACLPIRNDGSNIPARRVAAAAVPKPTFEVYVDPTQAVPVIKPTFQVFEDPTVANENAPFSAVPERPAFDVFVDPTQQLPVVKRSFPVFEDPDADKENAPLAQASGRPIFEVYVDPTEQVPFLKPHAQVSKDPGEDKENLLLTPSSDIESVPSNEKQHKFEVFVEPTAVQIAAKFQLPSKIPPQEADDKENRPVPKTSDFPPKPTDLGGGNSSAPPVPAPRARPPIPQITPRGMERPAIAIPRLSPIETQEQHDNKVPFKVPKFSDSLLPSISNYTGCVLPKNQALGSGDGQMDIPRRYVNPSEGSGTSQAHLANPEGFSVSEDENMIPQRRSRPMPKVTVFQDENSEAKKVAVFQDENSVENVLAKNLTASKNENSGAKKVRVYQNEDLDSKKSSNYLFDRVSAKQAEIDFIPPKNILDILYQKEKHHIGLLDKENLVPPSPKRIPNIFSSPLKQVNTVLTRLMPPSDIFGTKLDKLFESEKLSDIISGKSSSSTDFSRGPKLNQIPMNYDPEWLRRENSPLGDEDKENMHPVMQMDGKKRVCAGILQPSEGIVSIETNGAGEIPEFVFEEDEPSAIPSKYSDAISEEISAIPSRTRFLPSNSCAAMVTSTPFVSQRPVDPIDDDVTNMIVRGTSRLMVSTPAENQRPSDAEPPTQAQDRFSETTRMTMYAHCMTPILEASRESSTSATSSSSGSSYEALSLRKTQRLSTFTASHLQAVQEVAENSLLGRLRESPRSCSNQGEIKAVEKNGNDIIKNSGQHVVDYNGQRVVESDCISVLTDSARRLRVWADGTTDSDGQTFDENATVKVESNRRSVLVCYNNVKLPMRSGDNCGQVFEANGERIEGETSSENYRNELKLKLEHENGKMQYFAVDNPNLARQNSENCVEVNIGASLQSVKCLKLQSMPKVCTIDDFFADCKPEQELCPRIMSDQSFLGDWTGQKTELSETSYASSATELTQTTVEYVGSEHIDLNFTISRFAPSSAHMLTIDAGYPVKDCWSEDLTTSSPTKVEPAVVAATNVIECDPFTWVERCRLLEERNYSYKDHTGFNLLLELPLNEKLRPGQTIVAGDQAFVYKESIGSGSFANILLATRVGDGKPVALKKQGIEDAGIWEFYICSELKERLRRVAKAYELGSVMTVDSAFCFSNTCLLLNDYHQYGHLLDLVNCFKISANQAVPEGLVMYFTSELLLVLDALREARMVHADIKPDNILIQRIPVLDSSQSDEVRGIQPSVKLIDFGRAIDLSLYPPGTVFTHQHKTKDLQSVEMQRKLPWTYQLDAFGLVGVIITMLSGTYQKPFEQRGEFRVGGLKRWHDPVWTPLLHSLLNISSCENQPNYAALRAELNSAFRKSFQKDFANNVSTMQRILSIKFPKK